MAKENAEMVRDFLVVYPFDKFHKEETVEGVLYPDGFAVEGDGKTLKIPYSEIQYVAHCERPQARATGFLDLAPFAFGPNHIGAFAVETAAMFGIDAAEHAVAPNFYKNLCLVGYYEGREECWVMLQDAHTFKTNAFVQLLAARANTKVINYFMGLQRKSGDDPEIVARNVGMQEI